MPVVLELPRVAETEKPVKQRDDSIPPGMVLFLSIYEHYDLPAISYQKKLVTLENGNMREVETQVTRSFYFKNHRAVVTEEQAKLWRRRGMYGIHFIEAYPHPGIPRPAMSLYELLERQPAQAAQFLSLLEHHSGRVKVHGERGFTFQNEILREGARRAARAEIEKAKAELQPKAKTQP